MRQEALLCMWGWRTGGTKESRLQVREKFRLPALGFKVNKESVVSLRYKSRRWEEILNDYPKPCFCP